MISTFYSILRTIIPIGAAVRIVYCLVCRAMDQEEAHSYDVRMRNAIVFVCVSEFISFLVQFVAGYF